MSDLPKSIRIKEVGPREGFQFEKGGISLADKISLVDALSATGVKTIEFTSFVSPKWVPQMADADEMIAGIRRAPGVAYEAIWLNEAGLERAAKYRDVLQLRPTFGVAGTDTFMRKNTNRSVDERLEELPGWAERYQKLGLDWLDVGVMAAFGCNYEGDVAPKHVVTVLQKVEQEVDLGTLERLSTAAQSHAVARAMLEALTVDAMAGEAATQGDSRLMPGARVRIGVGSLSLFDGDHEVVAAQHRYAGGDSGGYITVLRLRRSDRAMFFLPEVGDEVLVAFMHGDIARPYVVGSLWNGRDRIPATACVGPQGGANR